MNKGGWHTFVRNLEKDILVWALGMAYLGAFRVFFIWHFREKIGPGARAFDFFVALINGFRLDAVIATAFVLIPFLLGLISLGIDLSFFAARVRYGFAYAFMGISSVLLPVSVRYFEEYNDQFNRFIFGLYYDDTKAIMTTIWKRYDVPLTAAVIICLCTATVLFAARLLRGRHVADRVLAGRKVPTAVRAAVTVIAVLMAVFALRGSFGKRPVQKHDVAISRDIFLNKAIVNPYFAIVFALQEHVKLGSHAGIESFLGKEDVRDAASFLFGSGLNNNIDDSTRRMAKGSAGPPGHIYLLMIESYDVWPMLDRYRSLGLAEGLAKLGSEGALIGSFLPSSRSTIDSLVSVMIGLPFSEVAVNYHPSGQGLFPTSVAGTFRKLGYRTRFFYGGNLSWQRIHEFALAQGFDDVFGAPDMTDGVSFNEWGVNDNLLYKFVLDRAEPGTPTFNLVLTTSNHPPYDVDVGKLGFQLKEFPDELRRYHNNDKVSLADLGQFWFADRCLSRFIEDAERKMPDALFAITGDHFGRKHISMNPSLYEGSAVPFVLYGKEALKKRKVPSGIAGSHLDIPATLIELAAPKGFVYNALGRDLLDPASERLGIGVGTVIGPDYIADMGGNIVPIKEGGTIAAPPDYERIRRMHNYMHAIGWWRVMCGPQLDAPGCRR